MDEAGYLLVNQYLQVAEYPTLFGAGDCVAFTPSLPKSGVYAVRMGVTLLRNLKALCQGQALVSYHPQKRSLALMRAGFGQVVATYGPLTTSGRWLWNIKDFIDRRFMSRFGS